MLVTFQDRVFPVIKDGKKLTVRYHNATRNVTGEVSSTKLASLNDLLAVQAQCCRTDADGPGADELMPLPEEPVEG